MVPSDYPQSTNVRQPRAAISICQRARLQWNANAKNDAGFALPMFFKRPSAGDLHHESLRVLSSMKANASCVGSSISDVASGTPIGALGRAVRASIGQPFARDTLDRERGAGRVIAAELDPVIVPEIELMQIPCEMGF